MKHKINSCFAPSFTPVMTFRTAKQQNATSNDIHNDDRLELGNARPEHQPSYSTLIIWHSEGEMPGMCQTNVQCEMVVPRWRCRASCQARIQRNGQGKFTKEILQKWRVHAMDLHQDPWLGVCACTLGSTGACEPRFAMQEQLVIGAQTWPTQTTLQKAGQVRKSTYGKNKKKSWRVAALDRQRLGESCSSHGAQQQHTTAKRGQAAETQRVPK